MKGTHLGEFEELVMLAAGALHPEAYGVAIKEEILQQAQRKVTLSTIHSALHRLKDKGLLDSHFGEATNIRGGKRKKYFTITAFGARCLREAHEIRENMYGTIPSFILEQA
jgi:DNA-binding PadR family transcriptional regulator